MNWDGACFVVDALGCAFVELRTAAKPQDEKPRYDTGYLFFVPQFT